MHVFLISNIRFFNDSCGDSRNLSTFVSCLKLEKLQKFQLICSTILVVLFQVMSIQIMIEVK